MPAYMGDVNVMWSNIEEVVLLRRTLKEYEAVNCEMINLEKSVGLQLGTWSSKLMLSASVFVVRH